jgi:hypothetical protein
MVFNLPHDFSRVNANRLGISRRYSLTRELDEVCRAEEVLESAGVRANRRGAGKKLACRLRPLNAVNSRRE